MAKETAEQKLLKLIESTDAQQNAGNPAAGAPSGEAQKIFQSVSSVGLPSMSMPPFLTQAINFFQGLLFSGKRPTSFGIHEFNKIFIVVLFIVGFLFVKEFMNDMKASNQPLVIPLAGNAAKVIEIALPTNKDLTEYLTAVQRRNIFQPYEPKVEEPSPQAAPAPVEVKPKINDQAKDLKLVGISWQNSPDSATAMIEDGATLVTSFVKQGDQIRGITIETIYADRVILKYEGDELDLKLY